MCLLCLRAHPCAPACPSGPPFSSALLLLLLLLLLHVALLHV
jgi:hypothetical protein